jgi:hypothetical protein
MRRLLRFPFPAGLVAIGLLSLACDDGAGPGTAAECTGPVAVTVGAGTVPRFSWTPACRLFLVLVEDPSGDGDQWGVISDSSNAIGSPVKYGTVPAGATSELLSPVALQAGHLYHMSVFRFTGPGHEDGTVIGETDFTP